MKKIKLDYDKCTACLSCEVACSLHHYQEINPQKSRIRIYMQKARSVPVVAGPFTEEECTSKQIILDKGREYDECSLCRASCPTRPWFKEPDTEIALQCDSCGDPPDPQCVKYCLSEALTLIEV
jgi:benzoyl-CoA reductase subunit BamC